MVFIKAIETKYAGCRFRSRLEARWAVFFDELGLQWEFEPEGFELGNGLKYLPDFLVRFQSGDRDGFYFEIKPTLPNEKAILKCHNLAQGLNLQREAEGMDRRYVWMLCGSPGHPELYPENGVWKVTKGSAALAFTGATDHGQPIVSFHTWAMVGGGAELDVWPIYFRLQHEVIMRQVDRFGSDNNGAIHFLSATFPSGYRQHLYAGKGIDFRHPRLESAYTAARSARFGVGGRG